MRRSVWVVLIVMAVSASAQNSPSVPPGQESNAGAEKSSSASSPGKQRSAPESASSPASSSSAQDSGAASASQNPRFTPPHSDRVNVNAMGDEPGESSSKDTKIDLTPPADDAKLHPNSSP